MEKIEKESKAEKVRLKQIGVERICMIDCNAPTNRYSSGMQLMEEVAIAIDGV